MEEAGFFNDKFQLGCGDSFEISDDETVPDSKAAAEGKNGKKGGRNPKGAGLPMIVEGEQDLSGSVAKYKKAMLNKRTVLKEVKDRLVEEKDDLTACEKTLGAIGCELNVLYKKLCDMELAA
ncbi:unnamed protein product, partial [Symbiodinium necroappetens]